LQPRRLRTFCVVCAYLLISVGSDENVRTVRILPRASWATEFASPRQAYISCNERRSKAGLVAAALSGGRLVRAARRWQRRQGTWFSRRDHAA
jgi:hypothetical protein